MKMVHTVTSELFGVTERVSGQLLFSHTSLQCNVHNKQIAIHLVAEIREIIETKRYLRG